MLLMPEPKVVNGPEIVSKYLGESENKVRDLFRDAEENPNEHHLIVFDEIDALVKPRGRGQGEAADQVVRKKSLNAFILTHSCARPADFTSPTPL